MIDPDIIELQKLVNRRESKLSDAIIAGFEAPIRKYTWLDKLLDKWYWLKGLRIVHKDRMEEDY